MLFRCQHYTRDYNGLDTKWLYFKPKHLVDENKHSLLIEKTRKIYMPDFIKNSHQKAYAAWKSKEWPALCPKKNDALKLLRAVKK